MPTDEPFRVDQIDHVELFVPDRREAAAWLALFQGTPQGSREAAGFHLVAFRVGAVNFVKFVNSLDDPEVTDHGAAWSIYFNDPFGHRLELTTYEHEAVAALLGRE